MKKIWVPSNPAILLGLLLSLALPVRAGEGVPLTAEGYGQVHIGMTVEQATRALGVELVAGEDETPNPECYHVHPKTGYTELYFMVQKGRIVRASLYEGPSSIRTDRGIGLGDSVESVRKAYGKNLKDVEHEYLGPVGRYLTWWDAMHKRGIRYETDLDGKVDTIHAGGEAITLVEGCS